MWVLAWWLLAYAFGTAAQKNEAALWCSDCKRVGDDRLDGIPILVIFDVVRDEFLTITEGENNGLLRETV